jgi:pilus assembly protein CpaE
VTLIVDPDPVTAALVQTALGGAATVLGSLDELELVLGHHPGEFAVVLGPTVDGDMAAALANRLRIQRPALAVILTRNRVDSTVLTQALRAGIREVIDARDTAGVVDAVRRAHEIWDAMVQTAEHGTSERPPRGHLITVFSTKGGVGKSTLATNIGASLAHDGKEVCIVDLDVQSGDVAIMLQISPRRVLSDLAGLEGLIDEQGIRSLLSEHSKGLSILAAPVNVEAQGHVSAEAVARVLDVLKEMFDVVVVDTSGTFDDFALTALDRCDQLVLIGTLDIPALKSLKIATGTLDLLNFSRSKWRLVLNRADARVGLSTKEFEDTLGIPVEASIPSSREVLAAVNRGETIVRAHPGHPVSQTISAFAASLVAQAQLSSADKSDDGSPASGGRRLLRRKVQ